MGQLNPGPRQPRNVVSGVTENISTLLQSQILGPNLTKGGKRVARRDSSLWLLESEKKVAVVLMPTQACHNGTMLGSAFQTVTRGQDE
ncbi:hypothetical protein TNCV_2578041 [Trichonephila clavipes]|nr:hypothetical protein TNCV_2578041 [Trichonephila clavipes]